MQMGDLVNPLGSCGGQPGATRCNVAMVLESRIKTDSYKAKIVCPCGISEVYRSQLATIEPNLAYSADPVKAGGTLK